MTSPTWPDYLNAGRFAAALATAPPTETTALRERIEAVSRDLSADDARALTFDARAWALPHQWPQRDDFAKWGIIAGRGAGKTHALCQYARTEIEAGRAGRVGLISGTAADVRDVLVETFLRIAPPWARPKYEASKRKLTWPSGATAMLFSAEQSDRLRGPEHDLLVADEIAVWPDGAETWGVAMLGLRLGDRPRVIFGSTPKPLPWIRDLLVQPGTLLSRASSLDNPHLPRAFRDELTTTFSVGSRFYRQEVLGELLMDIEGSLFPRHVLEKARAPMPAHESLKRVVVGLDPSATAGGDLAGVVVAGINSEGTIYVLDDRSLRGAPERWARSAVEAFHAWNASSIIGEKNQGGEMISQVIRQVDATVPVRLVHAAKSKVARAELPSVLMESGRLRLCGTLTALEDELQLYTPGGVEGSESPGRGDACVWAVHALAGKQETYVISGHYTATTKRPQYGSGLGGEVTADDVWRSWGLK